jgi:hypothetical protein
MTRPLTRWLTVLTHRPGVRQDRHGGQLERQTFIFNHLPPARKGGTGLAIYGTRDS